MDRLTNVTRVTPPVTTQPATTPGAAASAVSPEAFTDVLNTALQHLAQGQAPATQEEALAMARLIQSQVQMQALSLASSDPFSSDSSDDGSSLFSGLTSLLGTPGFSGLNGVPGLTGISGGAGLPGLTGLSGLSGLTGATPSLAPAAPAGGDAQARFAALKPSFLQAEKATGVPWQIQAAQWALETGWGQFTPSDMQSGQESYNLFGIKGSGPAGSVLSMTTEFVGGRMIQQPAAFRAYNSYDEAVLDHAQLLTTPTYTPAFANGTNLKGWTVSLQQLGYATDPNYADKLWSIVSANGWDKQ